MKYNVGDKVKVREDLVEGDLYGKYKFLKDMKEFLGKQVTIEESFENFNSYDIKEDDYGFYWTDDMFECKVYNDLDEFWDDWKNEKVCIKFNNSNDFNKFIDYHFKHFNIKLPKPNIEYFDATKYVTYYTLMPDKWGLANNNETNNYNVITYDDFIKLVEKDEKSPKNDKWDKNVPTANTDEMGVFESKNSNKNHILKENKIDKELNEKVEEEYKYILNSIRNKKEFDWGGFKNGEFEVVLKNREEANSFFNAMYDKYNIEHKTSYDEYFDFIEQDYVFIKYNEYEYDKWIWGRESLTDKVVNKIVNWSDYMDKENTTETLKDTLGKSSVERVLDSNVYNKINNSQQDIKQAFVDIDTSVLYKTRELFDTIRDEKDIEKIRNILNIIDRLVITKNKVLNDFDSCMVDELNKEE